MQKKCVSGIIERKILMVENENMERQIIHLEIVTYHYKKREMIIPLKNKFDQYVNEVSMFETAEEIGEDTVTKENNILLTWEPISFLLSGNVEYLC